MKDHGQSRMILLRRSHEKLARNQRKPYFTRQRPGGCLCVVCVSGNLPSGDLSLARSRGLQDADAEDLAQQVLVSISRRVENWKPDPNGPPFRAWLYRIAHNDCLKAITRRKPDSAIGSNSVQDMLNNVQQNEAEASTQLLHRKSDASVSVGCRTGAARIRSCHLEHVLAINGRGTKHR